jgi:hypothetical protein
MQAAALERVCSSPTISAETLGEAGALNVASTYPRTPRAAADPSARQAVLLEVRRHE